MKNLDYYEFDYDHVQAALNKHVEALIEVIQDMTNDLMWLEAKPFFDEDTGDWQGDTPLFDETTGQWTDSQRHDLAHKSIVRQLISYLDNTSSPPVWDEIEWPFVTRQDLTPEKAKQHFKEIAESGRDDSEKANEAALEIIFAEMKEREASAPKVDTGALKQALIENMDGLFYEYDMNVDKAMANHHAEFLNAADNPDVQADDYADKELHKAVSIALSKQIADFYRVVMPKVITEFDCPFIFPQAAIEFAKKQIEGD